jgi:hypothetical protein
LRLLRLYRFSASHRKHWRSAVLLIASINGKPALQHAMTFLEMIFA